VTIARGAAIGALLAAIVAIAVLMFGAGGGTEYKVQMTSASQLVTGNQVQVAGHEVGKVKKIELADDNRATVTIEVDEEFAPLHEGTKAIVRVVSLPSIANRNLSLAPGPNNAPEIPEGGWLDADETTSAVDLDQLFDTFDTKTRRSLQEVLQGFSNWYVGKGGELNEALKYFGPALSTTAQVTRELAADQEIFERFVVDSSKVVTALADRSSDVSGFVGNTNEVMRAIGDQNVALAQALENLPAALRKGNTTFVRLRSTLDQLNELTNVTKPVVPELEPFFRRLDRFIRTSTPTFRDFGLLLRDKGKTNDFIDLLKDFPPLAKAARKSSRSGIEALRKSQKVIEFIRPYAPDFTAWITKFAEATAFYDANGHYARVQPIFNAFRFEENGGDGLLVPLTPGERVDAFKNRKNERRCPGGATQPAPDRSNPFTDDGRLDGADCNPAGVPPGEE
jgi:phospholipid/cholesterol/gamma-HCH transport system substrate-binding protein